MRAFEEYHDTGGKTLLRGVTLPAGQSARADLDAALDNVFNHRNVGPFIGTHWANTFLNAPVASNGQVAMKTPPADLLVYFVPEPDWRGLGSSLAWSAV